MSFRSSLARHLPSWLNEGDKEEPGIAFRLLWTFALVVDAAADTALQGVLASVGRGTPTALPHMAEERGIIRAQGESDDDYGARLRAWVARWKTAGSALALARSIHEYCANHPRVRIVTRGSFFVTLEPDGTTSARFSVVEWDWDSATNPDRANDWADIWVIVYPTQWAHADGWGEPGDVWGGDAGFGHEVPRVDVDAIVGELRKWKSAHTCIRAVVWTDDEDMFDPDVPASLPDGAWGTWGVMDGDDYVPSSRDLFHCRYWEPVA